MTATMDGAEARNNHARPNGISLLDKVQFFQWACEQHQLEAADMNVLRVILFTVLGLENGKPHNGWCTANKLARMCGLDERTVRRVLARLQKLGLVKCIGARGRHGKTVLHVPGVVGAAENLPVRKLTDPDEDEDEPPSKIGRRRPNKTVENRAQLSAKIGRGCPMNPITDPFSGFESVERVSGGAAANPPPGEPSALNLEEGEEGAFGGEGRTLTRPRQRLQSRIVGEAKKLGLQDAGARFLRFATEVTVRDWLRWQREKRDQRLVQAIWQALVDEYGLDAEEAGRLLASKAEPKPPPEPARLPAPEAKPPPSAASSSPSRPPPAANGGPAPHPALRTVAAAIHEPVLRPPTRLAYACSAEAIRASAANLGIPRKGAAS
jgi:hypothetical protein